MKIAVDVRRVRDFGIGTYIRNLLDAISALNTSHQFLLIAHPDDAAQFRHLPPQFRVIPCSRTDSSRVDQFSLPWLIHKLRPDVSHIPLNRVPLLMPRPYVVTVHDMGRLLYDRPSSMLLALHRYRVSRGLKRASEVIAVSGATKRDIQNLFNLPEERINVVFNAPDPRFFSGKPAGAPEARQVQERERDRILERYQIRSPFLLYAGTIRAQKNIPRLVEAFAVVRSELAQHPVYRDLRLIIIGDEISHYPSVRRAVIQSRVEQAVRFLGFVPFETLRSFYQLASAFVFPSLYEGFGLPPLEAMASGTPVVTSNVSALPEVVGDAAVIVNPENVFDIARGIREVLTNEELRRNLVQRGLRRAESFSWERNAREVLAVYEDVWRRSK